MDQGPRAMGVGTFQVITDGQSYNLIFNCLLLFEKSADIFKLYAIIIKKEYFVLVIK